MAALATGPDARPIRDQLVEHAQVMSAYFEDLQVGLGVLHAAGIRPDQACRGHDGEARPVQSFRALTGWLRRAQAEGRLADCDVDTLASAILGALHNWSFTARVCGQPTPPGGGERHIERFIDLLWEGVRGAKP